MTKIKKDTVIDTLMTLKQEHGELCDAIHDQWFIDNVSAQHLAELDQRAEEKQREIQHYEKILASL